MIVRELLVSLGVRSDDRSMKRAERGIDRVADAGRTLSRLFIGGAVAVGFKKIIDAASEAGEAQNKFAAVFTEASESTSKQIADISRRTGQSNLELQKMAANIGALVKPSLGSAKAAGDLSAQFAELAFDISSFNDVRPEEALVALRSGLIGSAEPLQRFGVDVRVAALEQERLRLGYSKSIKDLKEGERIFIRQSAIIRQLGAQGALGDAEKTSKSFANASRALTGRIKELAAQLGAFILPAVEKLTGQLLEVTFSVQDFIVANKDLIRLGVERTIGFIRNVVSGLGDALQFVVFGWNKLLSILPPVWRNLTIVTGVVLGLVAVLGLPATLLLAIGAAILVVIDDFKAMGRGGNSVIGTLITGFQDLLKESGSVAGAIGQVFINAWEFWGGEVLGISKGVVDGITGFFSGLFSFITTFLDSTVGAFARSLGTLTGAVSQLTEGNFAQAVETLRSGIPEALGFDAGTGGVLAGGTINGSPAALAQASNAIQSTTSAILNIQGGPGQSAEDIGRGAVDRLNELGRREKRAALSSAGVGGVR